MTQLSAASADLTAVLGDCLRTRGQGLLSERRKLFGLLRDKVPGELRAVRLLILALDDGLPARLQGRSLAEADIQREASLFTASSGTSPDLAREAVVTWARVLTGFVPPTPAPARPAPLPSVAAVQIAPVQPLSVQPIPLQPVAPLSPGDSAPTAASDTPPTAISQTDIKKWISILVAVVLALIGASKLLNLFQSDGGSGQQTAGPPSTTPEGVPVVSANDPLPTFTVDRLGNDPMTLQFKFGVPVGNEAITYNVGFAFTRGHTQGQSRLIATKGGQQATGDNDAKRANDSDNANEQIVIGGGSFKTNPIGAPGVCVALMHFARRNDRLELTPRSTACVMASPGKDGNLCGDVVGCGVLK